MKGDTKDVGFIEDAATHLQNCIAAENHALMTHIATKNKIWMDVADMIRRNRSRLLYKMVPEGKGQLYCLAKHVLIMAVTAKELAIRYKEEKKDGEAQEMIEDAANYEALFRLICNNGEGGEE